MLSQSKELFKWNSFWRFIFLHWLNYYRRSRILTLSRRKGWLEAVKQQERTEQICLPCNMFIILCTWSFHWDCIRCSVLIPKTPENKLNKIGTTVTFGVYFCWNVMIHNQYHPVRRIWELECKTRDTKLRTKCVNPFGIFVSFFILQWQCYTYSCAIQRVNYTIFEK
jgi:hypothetical protein